IAAMWDYPRRIPVLALGLALVAGLAAFGQEASETGAGAPPVANVTDQVRQSAVVIDGKTLFSIRGVTAYPADRRARDIAGRIRALAANPDIHAGSLTLEERPHSTW